MKTYEMNPASANSDWQIFFINNITTVPCTVGQSVQSQQL